MCALKMKREGEKKIDNSSW